MKHYRKENYDDMVSEGLSCTAISLVGAFHGRYQELIVALKKTSESFQEFIAWARYSEYTHNLWVQDGKPN
jgi:uncharacterized membrane protein YjfL (UPF0719 family)